MRSEPSVRVDEIVYDNAVGRVLHCGHVYVTSAVAPWNLMAEHQPDTWRNVRFDFPEHPAAPTAEETP